MQTIHVGDESHVGSFDIFSSHRTYWPDVLDRLHNLIRIDGLISCVRGGHPTDNQDRYPESR
ncbi:transposase and inactivated derivatives [Microbacterium testaceum StLB037]|uniref:Transposase and inactivated derivatives n=1 Tax=Microbacterium testaceum (strain StLB037) TaxID=979556 RepID=E8NDN6_MICTS|nr:transposase and inactivated derivatives [Microbacterium testaceum StLB037]